MKKKNHTLSPIRILALMRNDGYEYSKTAELRARWVPNPTQSDEVRFTRNLIRNYIEYQWLCAHERMIPIRSVLSQRATLSCPQLARKLGRFLQLQLVGLSPGSMFPVQVGSAEDDSGTDAELVLSIALKVSKFGVEVVGLHRPDPNVFGDGDVESASHRVGE